MASNQLRPYGVGILDDIHGIFPELLYDSRYNSDIFRFMRGRVEYLYNDVYTRNRIAWTHIQDTNFATWRRNRENIIVSTPLVQPSLTPITPVRIAQTIPVPPAPIRRTRSTMDDYVSANALISLLSAPGGRSNQSLPMLDFMDLMFTEGGNPLTNAYVDVPVVPTVSQINRGSRLVPVAEIASNAICAICQEHGQETYQWRRLQCTHQFHNECILPWFERNSACPVCRADIRTPVAEAAPAPAPAQNLNTPQT